MVAAVNMQWLGIAVAAIVVVAMLAVVLLRNRREDEHLMTAAPSAAAGTAAPASGSFLDQPLTHGFEGLGKPATASAATMPWVATPLAQPEPVDPFAPHDDLFPTTPDQAVPDQAIPAPEAQAGAAAPALAIIGSQEKPEPSTGAVPPQAAESAAAPLSDVIVTSDHAEVDLHDTEVRAMLAELMQDEIDLARVQHGEGATLDAILQLTEAEKIAVALSADDKVDEIKALLADLQQ
jgi:hypothetical protein